MSKIKVDNSIFITTCLIAVFTLVIFVIAYQKNKHLAGLEIAKNLCIKTLPLIIITFILLGLIQAMVPKDLITSWIGEKSGFKGILLGSAIGIIIPGSPYVVLPILAGLYKTGGNGSIPVIVSIYSAKFLMGINRLPLEIGFLGPKFTIIRIAATIFLAPVSGLVSWGVMRFIK